MPLNSMPAIDANACSGWTEPQLNLYNTYQYWLTKMQVNRRKQKTLWNKFPDKRKWTPNMGPTMRAVNTEPSPVLRQFAFPAPITQTSKKDVIDIRERKQDEIIYKHKFESLVLDFLPSFQDWLNHVDDNSKDIMEKEERFEDVFIRGRMFHRSPFFWISDRAAGQLVAAPIGDGVAIANTPNSSADGKTAAFLQAMIAQLGPQSALYLENIMAALSVMETDLRVPAYSGSDVAKDDAGLSEKFALVTSSEAWNQFAVDPFLLGNKNCNMDIVTDRFKGSLFGRVTSILEDLPLRMKADGTFTAPETRELNPNASNYGETLPNPVYTSLDDNNGSPYEFAFLIGAGGYDMINIGPPPSQFASSGEIPGNFAKLRWNGEIELTKNFLVPCLADDGVTVIWETNQYGDKLKFISQVVYGILAKQPRNVLPILFKRKRGR